MAKSNKSKWILGVTGTALSAFVISQIVDNQKAPLIPNVQTKITDTMTKQEKELVQLDWSNYSINGMEVSKGAMQSDRRTQRS
ncbi:MAG TPA: hypothetical protein VJ546_09570 [Bacillales bacterium]|nr:hypothetical protein [Bacillales bacterium]